MRYIIVFFITLLFNNFHVSANGSFAISPPKFEFSGNPGEVIQESIKIYNRGDTPLTLQSESQDFIPSGTNGQPKIVSPEENDPRISLARWIKIEDDGFTIPPNGEKVIRFSITIPDNAEPGGKYGNILFSPPSGGGQIAVVSRIGSLILLRVNGEIVESGGITQFISSSTGNNFYSSPPVPFSVTYENSGNVHIKPQGKIEISNMFGSINNIGYIQEMTPSGVYTNVFTLTDYLPINPTDGNVLAYSSRVFETEFKGTSYIYTHENGTKEVRFKGFPLGLYTATLTLDGNESPSQTLHFIIFPWKEFLVTVILFIVVLKLGNTWRKKQRKALEEKIRKEMMLRFSQSQ